jgi:hypothetical protein
MSKEEHHGLLQATTRMQFLEPEAGCRRLPPVRGFRHAKFEVAGSVCFLPRCGATLVVEPEEGGMACVLCRQPFPRVQEACIYCGLRTSEFSLLKALEVPLLL